MRSSTASAFVLTILAWVILIAGIMTISCNMAEAQLSPPEFDEVQLRQPNSLSLPDGSMIAPMTQGLRAPFAGILWNEGAMAWLITDYEEAQLILIQEMDRRTGIMRAWAIREIATGENQHQTDLASLNLQLVARDDQIEDLEVINRSLASQVGFTLREKVIVVIITVGAAALAGGAGYLIGRAGR